MVYQQVQRLEKIVKDSESGLGTASSQINSLKDASHRLKSELEKTREELRTSKTNAANLKVSSSVDINCVKNMEGVNPQNKDKTYEIFTV